MTVRQKIAKILKILFLCVCVFLCASAVTSLSVKAVGEKKICTEEEAEALLPDAECILVLGCSVRNGRLSAMLEDRVRAGVSLFQRGAAPKLIMSGDHGRDGYNEVGPMKIAAEQLGVPADEIFMDHAGFSTYESLYRAAHIFGVRKLIIVSQRYHLFRALYIAKQLGIEAVGVPADPRLYANQIYRDVREWAARVKDFGSCLLGVSPTYGGGTVSLSQSGSVTDDDDYRRLRESGIRYVN